MVLFKMFLRNFLAVLSTVVIFANATTTPRATTYSNTTSLTSTSTSSSSSASITGACCFVVQDKVSEDWWQITTYSTGQAVINLTSITTYITPYPNGTVTSVKTNVYLTNGTFSWPETAGANPISNYLNGAPGPTEVTAELTGTAVTTGGVIVASPAAFYVYNSVKIITVAAVTDAKGNEACGTASAWNLQGYFGVENSSSLTFDGINSNAEAYFGGYGIGGATVVPTATFTGVYRFYDDDFVVRTTTGESIGYETLYTAASGATMDPEPTNTRAVEISLTTPFVYQPEKGKRGGEPTRGCGTQGPGKENYGYVPQEVIDYLAGIPEYSSQFPGLASCLPGGPSILPVAECFQPAETVQTAVGGDLTSSTVIIVTPPGGAARVTPTLQNQDIPKMPGQGATSGFAGVQGIQQTQPQSNAPQSSSPNQPKTSVAETIAQAVPTSDGLGGPQTQPQNQPPASIGAIINSMIGGAPNTPTPQGIIISGPTTIPLASVPAGLQGSTVNIQGTPVIIVPAATTLPPAQGSPQAQGFVIPGPTTIPVSEVPAGLVGQTTLIQGTPFIIVPSATTLPAAQGGIVISNPTTIPLAGAPAGLQGSTTVIGGSSFLVVPADATIPNNPAQGFIVPGPTTVPLAGAPQGLQGSTTVIDGTPFVIVPSATTLAVVPQGYVIPNPTTVPVAGAPQGLTGSTTVIGGTPYIIVPSATTLPIQGGVTGLPGASTTLIGGSSFVIIPQSTEIPLSEAPSGLSGSTTLINGTPFLIIPSATTLALSLTPAGESTTVFGGISFLIYPSPTTIPLSGAPAGLHGSTTTISGTPYLVISGPTTLPMSTSPPSTLSTSTSTFPGRITVISGSEFEIFSGPTTVPVDPNVSLKGKTTVISGTTEVILTAATTAPVKGTGSANGGANKSSAVVGRKFSWTAFAGLVGGAFGLVFW